LVSVLAFVIVIIHIVVAKLSPWALANWIKDVLKALYQVQLLWLNCLLQLMCQFLLFCPLIVLFIHFFPIAYTAQSYPVKTRWDARTAL